MVTEGYIVKPFTGNLIMKRHIPDTPDVYPDLEKIQVLLDFARQQGATRATRLSPQEIRVENKLASYCRTPKCPNFGRSMSCPPHVSGPAGFRKMVQESSHAIVVRIEIDAASLNGEERPQVMRLLHEITAAVEYEAKRIGFTESQGFAGGSCKMSFCPQYDTCRVLAGEGQCRHPDTARPSMSGYGVNVGDLMKTAGWSTDLFPPHDNTGEQQLAWVAGLILLR